MQEINQFRSHFNVRTLKGFLICYLLTTSIYSIIDKVFFNGYENASETFLYIIIIGLPILIPFFVIYFIYRFLIDLLFKCVLSKYNRVFILVIGNVLFLITIIFANWQSSKEGFHNFLEYISRPNLFIIFTITTMIQIMLHFFNVSLKNGFIRND
ncbi:MAG: hypothetical protein JWP69_1429 [Flaviaesturariibacter sp.]|nr:hypothetical protein [Flaviaesturariibacter sp.]